MKITRTISGKTIEIEPTPEDIFATHKEQEAQNLYDDVKHNMTLYLNDDEYERLKDNEDFIKDIAEDVQEQIDYVNRPFDDALENSIDYYKGDYLQ